MIKARRLGIRMSMRICMRMATRVSKYVYTCLYSYSCLCTCLHMPVAHVRTHVHMHGCKRCRLRLSFNGASSNIKFCETFETRLRVSSNMVDLMVIRESHSNFWCDLSKLGCKIHKKLPNMFGCKHNSTELASTELSTREFDT